MMHKFKGMMTSLSPHWATPEALYSLLDEEFKFDFDPCPLVQHPQLDGLTISWGNSTFVNPPYGRTIGKWIEKAVVESNKGKTIVILLPSRTDTKWWHDHVMKAHEIRFIKGRLKFGDSHNSAPFPSCVVIFKLQKEAI